MAAPPEQPIIVLPTGEVLTVADASTPELLVLDSRWPAGAPRTPPHLHPAQEERFTVLEGTVHLRAGSEEIVLHAGDSHAVAAGVAHQGWSADHEDARVRLEFRPALRWLGFVERFAALPPGDAAAAGALVAEFRDVVRFVSEAGPGAARRPAVPASPGAPRSSDAAEERSRSPRRPTGRPRS